MENVTPKERLDKLLLDLEEFRAELSPLSLYEELKEVTVAHTTEDTITTLEEIAIRGFVSSRDLEEELVSRRVEETTIRAVYTALKLEEILIRKGVSEDITHPSVIEVLEDTLENIKEVISEEISNERITEHAITVLLERVRETHNECPKEITKLGDGVVFVSTGLILRAVSEMSQDIQGEETVH